MSKVQQSPIAPPSEEDLKSLRDYTAKIDQGFQELFLDSHVHGIRSENPDSNEGELGDIIPIDDGTNKYLVVRFASGWFKTANLTAI